MEAALTTNVSRSGVLLKGVPAKLTVGDIIGLRPAEGKKQRFRVIWIGAAGTSDAGKVGLQAVEKGDWIWDGIRLPADDTDIYSRPPEAERRLLQRVKCLVSAEVLSDGLDLRALAFIRDLSLNGCYLAMTFPFRLQTKASVAMWLDEQRKMWVDGIVISSHPSTGMGIKFLNVPRPNVEALDRYLKQLSEPEQPFLHL
jgi:hypothetical protein